MCAIVARIVRCENVSQILSLIEFICIVSAHITQRCFLYIVCFKFSRALLKKIMRY
jgi:hypothetical protein